MATIGIVSLSVLISSALFVLAVSPGTDSFSTRLLEMVELSDHEEKSVLDILPVNKVNAQYETMLLMVGGSKLRGANANRICFQPEPRAVGSDFPQIVLSSDAIGFRWKAKFNGKLLVLLCLRLTETCEQNNRSILNKVVDVLDGILWSRVLVLVNERSVDEDVLQSFFKACQNLKLLNVGVISRHYSVNYNGFKYNFKVFPQFSVLREPLIQHGSLSMGNILSMPNHFEDLHGHPIRTYPDQLQPRTLLYRDQHGTIQMIGYVGRLLTSFAKRLNASLVFGSTMKIGESIFFLDLLDMVKNGSVDILASINSLHGSSDMENYSRMVEIASWFPMLPTPSLLPVRSIYALMLNERYIFTFLLLKLLFAGTMALQRLLLSSEADRVRVLLDFVFNARAFLGLIGGNYPETKGRHKACKGKATDRLVYLVLFVAGFFFSTFFSSFLFSNLTHPPREAEINSFADMKRANLKVLISNSSAALIESYRGKDFLREYGSLLQFDTNMTDFIRQRNSFNRSISYSTTRAIWLVYERQQSYFQRKLFRISRRVYFSDFVLYVLPMARNSLFELPLNKHILQLQSSGILDHWYRSTFFDMIQIGAMSFKDFSEGYAHRAANLSDLYWVWILYVSGILLSSLALSIEFLFKHYSWSQVK